MFRVWREDGCGRRWWLVECTAGLAAMSMGCSVDDRVPSLTEPERSADTDPAGTPAPNRDQTGVGSGGTSNQPGATQAGAAVAGNTSAASDAGTTDDPPDPAQSSDPSPDPPQADLWPPDTSITEAPALLTNSSQLTFSFTSTEPGTFECQMDSAVAESCTSPFTTSVAEGTHLFQVAGIDAAGNRDDTPAVFSLEVDLTPPETELRGAPAAASGRFAAFAFSSADATASFECSLDSATAYEVCTSPHAYVITSVGSHTFRVRAADAATNRDPTPASSTFTASPMLATPFSDSSTLFCSDGTAAIPCPLAGAVAAGQDGNYLVNRPIYTQTADTVLDSISGLTWERASAAAADWDTQVSRCAGLTTGGLTDWRLPSRLEVLTLLDAGLRSPAIDTSVFDAPAGYYWIGEELDDVPSSAWSNDAVKLSYNGKNAQYFARCVSGASFPGAFSAAANGQTVNDSRTGLIWQTASSGTAFTWTAALVYCNDLVLASSSDWRLPTVKELQTLTAVGNGLNPTGLPPAFPPETAVDMWSSSPDPAAPSSSYTVSLLYGFGNSMPTSTQFPVRCVR
jgi:hypothetical protein